MLTKDSICTCNVLCIAANGVDESTILCGSDVYIGCSLTYSFMASDGGYYTIYGSNNKPIEKCTIGPATVGGSRGGGFIVCPEYTYIVFGPTVTVCKTVDVCVGDLISNTDTLEALYEQLNIYGFNDDESQQIVNLYLSDKKSGSIYEIGHGLKLVGNTLEVNTTDEVEGDNTLPITSAAVHTTVGNIEVLLSLI